MIKLNRSIINNISSSFLDESDKSFDREIIEK